MTKHGGSGWGREGGDAARVARFTPRSAGPARRAPRLRAWIALVALAGSLVAAAAGPAGGGPVPYPLLLLLALIGG